MNKVMCSVLLMSAVYSAAQAGDGNWTSLGGPDGGPIRDLTFAPNAAGTVYAATQTGILYKSSDSGGHWQKLSTPTGITLTSIAVDTANIVYFSNNSSKIWKSADSGATWQSVNMGIGNARCDKLSAVGEYLYCSSSIELDTGAVYSSHDHGASWHVLDAGLDSTAESPPTKPSGRFTVDAINPDLIYEQAVTGTSNLGPRTAYFRSRDRGITWSAMAVPGQTLVVDPTTAGAVYAVRYGIRPVIFPAIPPVIFYSEDAGDHWRRIRTPKVDWPNDIRAFAVDPQHRETLYLSTTNSLFKSGDRGAHWQRMFTETHQSLFDSLAVDPSDSQHVVAWSTSGIQASSDGGSTWHPQATGIHHTSIASVVAGTQDPLIRYATTAAGLYKSTNRGVDWERITTEPFAKLIAVPGRDDTLYSLTGVAASMSTDGGRSWKSIFRTKPSCRGLMCSERGPYVTDAIVSPSNPDALYVVTMIIDRNNRPVTTAVYRSLNGGNSWKPAYKRQADASVVGVAFDPVSPTSAYLVAEVSPGALEIHRTDDNGKTWPLISHYLRDSIGGFSAFALDPTTGDVYLSLTKEGVTSHDRGASWQSGGFSNVVNFLFDARNPQAPYMETADSLLGSINIGRPDPDHSLPGVPPLLLDASVNNPTFQSWANGLIWEYTIAPQN